MGRLMGIVASGAYFTLPWQVINAAFAGYTAYALSQKT